MKGKWAEGIEPRNFAWVIKGRLAVSERPGGYARNHRKVRRQEEIIWIRQQGFTRVVSLLGSPHNLHAYDELGVDWSHLPFGSTADARVVLTDLFEHLDTWFEGNEQVLVHQEELGDRLMGTMAAYLLHRKLLPSPPHAIAIVERIMHRQMGTPGREVVAIAATL